MEEIFNTILVVLAVFTFIACIDARILDHKRYQLDLMKALSEISGKKDVFRNDESDRNNPHKV